MSIAVVLPEAKEQFTASRGPFSIPTTLQPQVCHILLALPFWTSRESLKLFTELYLTLANGKEGATPLAVLERLIESQSPYEDYELHRSSQDSESLEHWALMPKGQGAQTIDELREAAAEAKERDLSVIFKFDSEAAEATIVHSGKVHKIGENSFTLKRGRKYRTYAFENVSNLLVVNGRSSENGVPTLRLKDRKPEDGGLVTIQLGVDLAWSP